MPTNSVFRPKLLRWSLTAGAAATLPPILAWLLRPTAHLLPFGTDVTGGLAGGLALITRNPTVPGDGLYLAANALIVVSAVTAVALALAVLWRGTLTRAALQLVISLLGYAGFASLTFIALPFGAPAAYGWLLGRLGPLANALAVLLGASGLVALVRFTLLFTQPLRYADLAPHVSGWRSPKKHALRAAMGFFGSSWSWIVLAGGLAATALFDELLAAMLLVEMVMFACIAAYLFLRLGRTAASAEHRRRIDTIFVGFSAAVWAGVLVGVLPFAAGPLVGDAGYSLYVTAAFGFGPTIVTLCLFLSLAAAVLLGGALDPAIALTRTTVYGALGVLYVVGFGTLENLFFGLLEEQLALSSFASSVLLGGPLAALMIPIHQRLERLTERRTRGTEAAQAVEPLEETEAAERMGLAE